MRVHTSTQKHMIATISSTPDDNMMLPHNVATLQITHSRGVNILNLSVRDDNFTGKLEVLSFI